MVLVSGRRRDMVRNQQAPQVADFATGKSACVRNYNVRISVAALGEHRRRGETFSERPRNQKVDSIIDAISFFTIKRVILAVALDHLSNVRY